MGLLSKMQEKATKQWAQNLTLEQIEEYERQGMDMSEYRVIYEENQAEKQRIADAIDLSRLDRYKKTGSMDDAFVEDVAKFNKLSDKKKQLLEQAPLVYGRVVQAYSPLYKPTASKKNDGGGIVFVFALDNAHCYNEEWLAKTAKRISAMKDSVDEQPVSLFEKICGFFSINNNFFISIILDKKKIKIVPEDSRDFITILRSDTSSFCMPLTQSLNDEGADAWCATYSLDDQNKLPLSCIPPGRIIPFLLTEQLKEKKFGGSITDSAQLIPPAYYTK